MERKEAIKLNMKTYRTNRPCKHGHLDDRRTDTGACCECLREKANEVYAVLTRSQEQIAAITAKIHIYCHDEGIPILKMMVDQLIRMRFPDLHPDAVNPANLPVKRVSVLMRQVAVRVPIRDVDTAADFSRLLSPPVDLTADRARILEKSLAKYGPHVERYIPAP